MMDTNEIRLVLARILQTQETPTRTMDQIESVLRARVARERERAVALCRHRADLWTTTLQAKAPAPAPAREEARARSNEARYLADLIESETDLFPTPDA